MQLITLVRRLDTGQDAIRDAGGPISGIQFGPKRLFPPLVAVMSPNGMRDVLGRSDASSEHCVYHDEVRNMAGDSLFVLPNEQWRPRKRALQPVFTKHNIDNFGGHMSRAARAFVDRWTPVQVLHEALRLCPPAAGVARLATQDIAVDGYRIEAGTLVAVGLYGLHHDPALWPEPKKFDPDRFSRENVRNRNRWQFLPFLGGGRPCIGEHFARLETTLALATIVGSMKFRSIDDVFECDVPFTTVAKGPIRARLQRRN